MHENKCVHCENKSGFFTGKDGECDEVCGDGFNHGYYECDDHNTLNNDGCDATCKVEAGWSCTGGGP